MRCFFLILMSLGINLSAETTIEFSALLGDKYLNKAIDMVTEEAKNGFADIEITYSTSMGQRTINVKAKFLSAHQADSFISLGLNPEICTHMFILKDGKPV